MTPRPRKDKNDGLPPNLYPNNEGTSYRYRRPDNGDWSGMGADRQKAISAAKKLNSLLMPGEDLVRRVMGGSDTLGAFLRIFENEIIPPRKLAKNTLSQYRVRLRQAEKHLGESTSPRDITTKLVATMLDGMPARSSNQMRTLLIDVFNHAIAKGLMDQNPAAITIARIEEKVRQRHTIKGLRLIRACSPAWLQNAIDTSLITSQARDDIVSMRFDDEKDEADGSYFYFVRGKTADSDAAWIRFKVTPEFRAVINRCRDDIVSPFLIHRRPERIPKKEKQTKLHWTQITPAYLSRAFQAAREAANPYPHWTKEQQPGFHEIRALSLHLYKRAGKGAVERQNIAGHADGEMTRNYEKDHHDIVWTDAVPDLDISEITG